MSTWNLPILFDAILYFYVPECYTSFLHLLIRWHSCLEPSRVRFLPDLIEDPPDTQTLELRKKLTNYDLTHSERRPQRFIPNRKSTSIVSSNWQQKFLYFHYKSVKVDVLCRKYEYLAILSNLNSCQFAPKIVIFKYVANLRICRLFRLK